MNGPRDLLEVFDFGRHRGVSHDDVLSRDPSYVKWAYENVAKHAGISRATYVAACDALEAARGEAVSQQFRWRPLGQTEFSDWTSKHSVTDGWVSRAGCCDPKPKGKMT